MSTLKNDQIPIFSAVARLNLLEWPIFNFSSSGKIVAHHCWTTNKFCDFKPLNTVIQMNKYIYFFQKKKTPLIKNYWGL